MVIVMMVVVVVAAMRRRNARYLPGTDNKIDLHRLRVHQSMIFSHSRTAQRFELFA